MTTGTDPAQATMFPELEPSAEALRDAGIKKAVDHANETFPDPEWSKQAYSFLLNFLTVHDNQEFTSEQIRIQADGIVPEPPDPRAWGGVFIRASKSGLIVACGWSIGKRKECHMGPKRLWKRNYGI
jgi:hypothetical protein